MSAVLAKPQVKDFLKTLAKGKEKGQEQRKEHDVNAHAATAEGEPSKKPWEEDIPELSSPSYSPPTSFSYSSDSSSSSNPRRRRKSTKRNQPKKSFVEYKGIIPSTELESTREGLEMEINRLINLGGKVKANIVSFEEALAMCGGKLPSYISKEDKPRIVCLGGNLGCPCGGTHVADISSIGKVKIVIELMQNPLLEASQAVGKGLYEVDDLSTHEKSHITYDVLAQIPAHIFIAKFKDVESESIQTTIMPREIWTLHRKPKVINAVRAIYLDQFFRLPPWKTDYMRAHELMSSIQPVKTTTTATSSRSTRSSKKSSSDDKKIDTNKEEDSQGFDKKESQKGAEAKGPSEHEPSDQEDTSTPLDRKSKKPRFETQVTYAKAQARVEARKKELADARAAKAASK
ncbi:hypothetical protein L7F22_051938 [Adiantum nelumboides]|nr:hypothetical protein [Adiantum nelumboides]